LLNTVLAGAAQADICTIIHDFPDLPNALKPTTVLSAARRLPLANVTEFGTIFVEKPYSGIVDQVLLKGK
jgi:hypothetical protein